MAGCSSFRHRLKGILHAALSYGIRSSACLAHSQTGKFELPRIFNQTPLCPLIGQSLVWLTCKFAKRTAPEHEARIGI